MTFNSSNKFIQFEFSMIFTSIQFAIQVGNILETVDKRIVKTIRSRNSKNIILYQLRINSNDMRYECVRKIYDWFYTDSTIYLNRKKQKFENYFEYRDNCKGKYFTTS